MVECVVCWVWVLVYLWHKKEPELLHSIAMGKNSTKVHCYTETVHPIKKLYTSLNRTFSLEWRWYLENCGTSYAAKSGRKTRVKENNNNNKVALQCATIIMYLQKFLAEVSAWDLITTFQIWGILNVAFSRTSFSVFYSFPTN